jgi:hypothetical protein
MILHFLPAISWLSKLQESSWLVIAKAEAQRCAVTPRDRASADKRQSPVFWLWGQLLLSRIRERFSWHR